MNVLLTMVCSTTYLIGIENVLFEYNKASLIMHILML